MNEHIVFFLDRYLDISEPDFAVMLKGEWGCGKTYFIRNYLEQCEKANRKIRYVSLNGISDPNDIVTQLLSTSVGGKVRNFVRSLKDNISVGYVGFNLNLSNVLRVDGFKTSMKDSVLVFDDFERCKIDKTELMGYLSIFVEQQNLHVIIIADESKIIKCSLNEKGQKQNSDEAIGDKEYIDRKEKIIGRTLEIESSDSDIIKHITDQLEFPWLKALLEKYDKIFILHLKILEYCNRKNSNYRIIKHAFREFAFVFDPIFSVEELKEYHQTIFENLFSRFFPVFCCLQFGSIQTGSELDELLSFRYYNDNREDDRSNKIYKFKNTFSEWYLNSFLSNNIWKKIFTSQKLCIDEILQEVRSRVVPQKENWEVLWHYFDMNDKDIERIYNLTMTDISEMKMKTVTSILHVFSSLMGMADNKFIDKTPDDILTISKDYFEKLGTNLLWNDSDSHFDAFWDSCSGYGYHARELPQFRDLMNLMEEKLSQKAQINRHALYLEFVNLIGEDEDCDQKIIDPKYRYKDIFSENDPKMLWSKIESLSPRAFREICHAFDGEIVEDQLMNHFCKQQEYWTRILEFAETFLHSHTVSNTEKSKCQYLRKYFIPKLKEELNKRAALAAEQVKVQQDD